ncbi:calcium-binding protein [Sphingobium abikonense]|uniref:calcium-binding protein n=1 Tax=Sphingobium abikonense TaxID=86193 RepID=UPI000787F46E|nr:calcium-binding protein [Sphingobium abikonense]
MIRAFLLATVLTAATPALAQQAMTPGAATQPAQPSAAMPAQPSAATPAQSTPAQSTPGASVASIVDSEFPAYDANGDGQLDQSEFSRWMLALKNQEMKATGQQLPADQVTAWANGAFSTADADKSLMVSKPELITYLSAGA